MSKRPRKQQTVRCSQPPAPSEGQLEADVLAVDLAALDALPAGHLAIFCWRDVRPLGGVAGLLDWRLNGQISQLLLAQRLVGNLGEAVLVPIAGRLGRRRLFCFGLGESALWDRALFKQAAQLAYGVMARAGALPVMFAAPVLASNPKLQMAFAHSSREALGPHLSHVLVVAA